MKSSGKIIPLLLLAIVLLIGGRYILFTSFIKTQKSEFRKTILKEGSGNIILIRVVASDLFKNTKFLEWKDNNKEVIMKGKYHEVLCIRKEGKNYLLTLIEDNIENELFSNYFDLNSKSQQSSDALLLLIAMNFFLPVPERFQQPETGTFVFSRAQAPGSLDGFQDPSIKPPQKHFFLLV